MRGQWQPTMTPEEEAEWERKALSGELAKELGRDDPRIGALRIVVKNAPHGTVNGYKNWKCICQPCRDANAAYQREKRARQKARTSPVEAAGGVLGTYPVSRYGSGRG